MERQIKFNPMPEGRQMLLPDSEDLIVLDGEFMLYKDVKWGWSNPGTHYGRSVFSGAQIYKMPDGNCTIYALEEHIVRLLMGAQDMGFLYSEQFPYAPKLPIPDDEIVDRMVKETWDLVERTGAWGHYVRHNIWHAEGSLGVKMGDDAKLSYSIMLLPFKALFSDEKLKKGLRILLNENPRYHRPSGIVTIAKSAGSGHYAAVSTPAKDRAIHDFGCDDVLLQYRKFETGQTLFAECSTNNLLLVSKEDTLVMPKPYGNFLFGTTAQSVLYLAHKLGIKFQVTDVSAEDLKKGKFRAACTLGNAAGVSKIGTIVFENGDEVQLSMNDEVVDRLKAEYDSFVRLPDAWRVVPFRFDNGRTTDFQALYDDAKA